jgi:PKD repeat protein
MFMRYTLFALLAALSGAACPMGQADAPTLTGPSEYATSLRISANPDAVAMGQSATVSGQQSLVIVTVFDEFGQPKPNQLVRFETLVNGQLSDCGQLSRASATTGGDGQASTVFIAPGTPPDCANFNPNGSVTVRATPVGVDFASSSSSARSVSIFMALPSANPASGIVVNFSILPNPGRVGVPVSFTDAGSFSAGRSIVGYRWNWSDGATKLGSSVTHDFAAAGTYVVTLTVTDDIGQESFKSALVAIED